MKIACQSCQAQYKVGDDKVRGKIVRIRCRKCGAVVVFDGSTAAFEGGEVYAPPASLPAREVAPQATGERNETSVLFSLAALAQSMPRRAPEPPASEASSLIDLRALAQSSSSVEKARPPTDDIMRLSAGDVFAPVLTAPAIAYEPAAPPPRASAFRDRWLAVAVAMVIALAGVVVVGIALRPHAGIGTAGGGSTATATATTAIATSTATATATATSTSTPTPTPTPTATPTATAHAHAVGLVPTSAPSSCCPGESDIACAMRRSAGAACFVAPFDRDAASRALGAVDVSACKTANQPSGRGHVKVTFEPNGGVSKVEVDDGTFAGTEAGDCVARKYRGARVPAFSGGALTAGKSFAI